MKNPFKREDRTALIAVITVATLAVGAIGFLYLTEKGRDTRRGLKKKIKSIAKNAAVKAVSKKTKIPKKAVKAAADQIVKE
jgi:hypothetical protein